MSYADEAVRSYQARTGVGPPIDAEFQYQWVVMRDLLARLEVILDDEGIPREQAQRIIRCVLYGAPGDADAMLRVREREQMRKMLESSVIPLSWFTTREPRQSDWPTG